ncbi:MAG: hypothetical protein PSN34_09735 [Urechidicola sp.]|nr:hypothetical protein [Urechidicola sp.]
MNKLFYSTILFFGLSLSLFSQTKTAKDTLYFDENEKEISQAVFKKKCNAAVFNCQITESDSLTTQRVFYNFYFGKISTDEFENIVIHFNAKSDNKLSMSSNILIYHRDKLLSFKEGRRLDSLNSTKSKKITKKKYTKYKKRHDDIVQHWNKSRDKFSKEIKKNHNTSTLFVANKNYGYELENEYFTWIIDDFSFLENSYYQSIIILKPNGDYFISFGRISASNLFNIIKSNSWLDYQSDFEKSVKTNYSVGYGIVKDLVVKKYTL